MDKFISFARRYLIRSFRLLLLGFASLTPTLRYEANRAEITLCEAAERYLKGVLQSRYDPKKLPPVPKWKEERAAKTAEKGRLEQEYVRLKDEIREVKIVRKAAEQIARQIDPQERTRARGIGDLTGVAAVRPPPFYVPTAGTNIILPYSCFSRR
jgi:hypothetical protein